MFGIKDIPQSLIDIVNEVLLKDKNIQENDYQDVVKTGLEKYGVSSPNELSDADKKEFFDWLDANWKKSDEIEESGLLPVSKNDDEDKLNEVAPPDVEIEKWTSDPDVKASFKKQYGDRWQEVLYAKAWQKYNAKHESFAMNEAISITSDNLASDEPRSALGQRNEEYPKHVDVVKEDDFRPLSADGTKLEGYRLLIQYSTNTRPQFVPELSLPAAPTLEALTALIPGSPAVVEAITNALNLPHLDPHFSGQKDDFEDNKS